MSDQTDTAPEGSAFDVSLASFGVCTHCDRVAVLQTDIQTCEPCARSEWENAWNWEPCTGCMIHASDPAKHDSIPTAFGTVWNPQCLRYNSGRGPVVGEVVAASGYYETEGCSLEESMAPAVTLAEILSRLEALAAHIGEPSEAADIAADLREILG